MNIDFIVGSIFGSLITYYFWRKEIKVKNEHINNVEKMIQDAINQLEKNQELFENYDNLMIDTLKKIDGL